MKLNNNEKVRLTQALVSGTPSLQDVLEAICNPNGCSYNGNTNETIFNEGKRYVYNKLFRMLESRKENA